MTILAHSKQDQDEFKAMSDLTATAATTAKLGMVKKATTVANATVAADGTSAGTQLNALLAALRTAGIIT